MGVRLLLGILGILLGCGGTPQGSALDPVDEFDLAGRPALQMYLVLTDHKTAMQTPGDVEEMWSAVHGVMPEFKAIRQAVRWAPSDYKIDIELDFADLPHPSLPQARLAPLLRRLTAPVIERAHDAQLAISVRSRSVSLPEGEHIRLVGAAVLQIAERYDGVVIDLLAQRAWSTDAWRRELTSNRLSSRQVRLVRQPLATGVRLRTRGHLKYGLPDLELDVTAPHETGGQQRLVKAQSTLLRGGRLAVKSTSKCLGAGYDGDCLRLATRLPPD